MVTDFWRSQPPLRAQRKAADFCDRLKVIKKMTEDWAKRKCMRDDQLLLDTEAQIAQFMDERGTGFLSEE